MSRLNVDRMRRYRSRTTGAPTCLGCRELTRLEDAAIARGDEGAQSLYRKEALTHILTDHGRLSSVVRKWVTPPLAEWSTDYALPGEVDPVALVEQIEKVLQRYHQVTGRGVLPVTWMAGLDGEEAAQ